MNKIRQYCTLNNLIWLTLAFGILSRATQYLSNRSFWLDEVVRVFEFKEYSLIELLQIKGFVTTQIHTAPYGFLAIQRSVFLLLGDSEFIFRLFPFICGILSLFLYKNIVNWFIPKKSGLIAFGLFAVSYHLIFYSSEAKPYSSDVLFTLLILILLKRIYLCQLKFTEIIAAGFLGGISVWFSFPAVFTLFGGGLALIIDKIWNKDWKKLFRVTGIYVVWLSSFLVYYVISLRYFSNDQNLLNYWSASFSALSWQTLSLFYQSFKDPGGLLIPQLGFIFFFFGFYSMLRDKEIGGLILGLPILLTIVSSMLKKYPYADRLILFLMPAYYLLIAKGFEFFSKAFDKKRKLLFVCVFLLLAHPLLKSIYHNFKPLKNEEIKTVISHLKQNYRQGDSLYIYYGAEPAFEYYSEKLNFEAENLYFGKSSRLDDRGYIEDVERFIGKQRVWFLFSHYYNDEEKLILYYLNQRGKKIDSFEDIGSSAHLYDLTSN